MMFFLILGCVFFLGIEGDTVGECSDGLDNDDNGLMDCDDPGCLNGPDCDEDFGQDDSASEGQETGL